VATVLQVWQSQVEACGGWPLSCRLHLSCRLYFKGRPMCLGANSYECRSQCVAVSIAVLQRVAVCGSVLQCVAVCCSVSSRQLLRFTHLFSRLQQTCCAPPSCVACSGPPLSLHQLGCHSPPHYKAPSNPDLVGLSLPHPQR